MSEVITIPELDEGAWPIEFSGMWMNTFKNVQRNTQVLSLYANSNHEEGEILDTENSLSINQPFDLPDAYISVYLDSGVIAEVYVKASLRGKKIGTMLCAFARSYLLKNDIIVVAPSGMTNAADSLYRYISSEFGEPYVEPEGVPLFYAYTDFNGGWTMGKIREVETNV
jgi:hypothetical protein